MHNNYNLYFIDNDFFNHISQFKKGTFNFYTEQAKLVKPYREIVKLKDAFPDYEKRKEGKKRYMPNMRNQNVPNREELKLVLLTIRP